MVDQLTKQLREAYNHKVEERDRQALAPWKIEERQSFLGLLQKHDKTRLLDIGAGPGTHAKFFQDSGLQVTCTDLSPEMVKRCRQKGLTAYVMDFLSLDFPAASFEAVFAMNCLLHLPPEDLPGALRILARLLAPDGFFYWGQYGGPNRAGVWPKDHYQPRRYFSFLSDAVMHEVAAEHFAVHSFKTIAPEPDSEIYYQAIILRPKGLA